MSILSNFPTAQPAPIVGENGNWWVWDAQTQAYVDTGVVAGGDAILSEQDTDGFYINRIVGGGGGSGGSGGSGSVTVDSTLSATSENPVQNKVIKAALDSKGTYSKPNGGIPKTDLDAAVQTSLGKADTALQTHQDISGKITAPTNPVAGQFLVYDGSAWTAQTLAAWQGGNY